jgi:predicted glycosyltransferase
MREFLQTNVGAYPLYTHCFGDILNRRLCAKLESDDLFAESKEAPIGAGGTPSAGKIRHYMKSILKKPNAEECDMLLLSRYRPINIGGADGFKADYLFDSVIDEVHKAHPHPRMALVCIGGHGDVYTDWRVANFSLFEFLSLRILLKSVIRSVLLRLRYKRIARRLSIVQKKMFDSSFSFSSLLFYHLLDFCLSRTISSLKPKVVVANDDILIFKPSTNHHFQLIVLQSALITEQIERHKNLLFSSFLEDRLLSDYFCVSGSLAESLKRKYLKDTRNLVMTGQPRFDNLVKADKLFDKDEICKRLGLIGDRRILVWATETHSLPLKENRENVEAVCAAVKSLENVGLVVKLHPAEDQDAPLYKENPSCTLVIVKGSENISESLFVCDAMITKSSTAAIEAAILNKPIIVLNLSGEPDIMPYVKEGVALGVYKKQDLVPAIKQALYDEKTREKLAKVREKFVYEYAYVQDGKASERVAEIVTRAVKGS